MAKAKIKTKPEAAQPEIENKFSKSQLIATERFRDRRDILTALLSPKETYTVSAVENMIENYMKGQVK